MFLPIIIFLMILSPVLIPTTITAVHAIARRQQTYRRARAASYPGRLPSRRLAVAAA